MGIVEEEGMCSLWGAPLPPFSPDPTPGGGTQLGAIEFVPLTRGQNTEPNAPEQQQGL